MKKKITVSLLLCLMAFLCACGKKNTGKDITIVYTNDIHSYIDNVVTNENNEVIGDGMRFSKVAAMVGDMKAEGREVLLVDAGDEFQGDIYGAMDDGGNIVSIMNATGYDLATPGNHDFDYGVSRFFELTRKASYPYISCNFHKADSDEEVLPATKIFDIGGRRIAFIGITTPETFASSTPVYFQDENGNFIYSFDGIISAEDLYSSVQTAIDSVRKDADIIIALGHIGVGMDEKKQGISSEDIIANTSGLDAFIDGHSHTTMVGEKIKDKKGKTVLLTQTGNYLEAVGVMTISGNGDISTELVTEYEKEDESVAALEQEWIDKVGAMMNEKIATLENTLYIHNPENGSQRYIRSTELNLGDLTADSIYWFFNERLFMDCDVVLQNGGGIRNKIEAGDVSYYDIKQVEPFGNMVCLISATGQQIIDALEMGVMLTGEWDEEWNIPAENGGFLHVAGLTYTVDASIPGSVEKDDNGLFSGVSGEYRVRDVKVYNRASGEYEPIDPAKEYMVGGQNYLLRNSGNGLCMFADDELQIDYAGQDYVVLAEYIKSFETEGDYPLICTDNSPLNSYAGYLLDYDNPYGAGRIVIENLDYEN